MGKKEKAINRESKWDKELLFVYSNYDKNYVEMKYNGLINFIFKKLLRTLKFTFFVSWPKITVTQVCQCVFKKDAVEDLWYNFSCQLMQCLSDSVCRYIRHVMSDQCIFRMCLNLHYILLPPQPYNLKGHNKS